MIFSVFLEFGIFLTSIFAFSFNQTGKQGSKTDTAKVDKNRAPKAMTMDGFRIEWQYSTRFLRNGKFKICWKCKNQSSPRPSREIKSGEIF